MSVGKTGRSFLGPFLVVNLVMYLIILGLTSWSLDKFINNQQNHPHLGGNPSTRFMLIFALLAGVTGVCSNLAGLLHLRAWGNDSLACAASSAIISWAVTTISFGLVCKEINLGGHRGRRLRTLEAFIIILTMTQVIYLGLLHAGIINRRYEPGYHNQYGVVMGSKAQKTGTPAGI